MASPRLLALLGLLAVAGYQNRDKLQSVLGNITGQNGSTGSGNRPEGGGLGGLLGNLGGLFGGGAAAGGLAGGGLSGALGDLIGQFSANGHGRRPRPGWTQVPIVQSSRASSSRRLARIQSGS